MKNYYNILEVSENASIEVIEKAHKVLVKKYHPDLQGHTPETEMKIREINEAYNVLSDNFLKEQYDKELQRERQKQNETNFDEAIYGRLYREQERQKYEAEHEKKDKEDNLQNNKEEKVGSYKGIIELLKSMFKYKPNISNIKEIRNMNVLALVLTILLIVGIGLILYCIPFTHDWMYRNFIDTPLLRWLFK